MKKRLIWLCLSVLILTTFIVVTIYKTPSDDVLTSLSASLYRDDSYRPQPELVNAGYSSEEINKIEKWIDSGDSVGMPLVHKIQHIWALQLDFENEGEVTKTEYYMYVDDLQANVYIKQFDLSPAYDLDKYDHSMDALIMERLGSEGWSKVSPFLF